MTEDQAGKFRIAALRRREVLGAGIAGTALGTLPRLALAQTKGISMEVEGSVAPGYESVRDAFSRAMTGDPGGAQLCVYRHGERVVDLWCGRDPIAGRPFTADTIGILMSASKGVTTTCAHLLAERGLIDLEAPVAHYWPEFAQNGKAQIPVKYLLSHKAGLAAPPPGAHLAPRNVLDWRFMTDLLAGMKPLWEPGTAYAYHTIFFGWLVGEVIRRVTGRPLGETVAAEISGPLKADLWLGLPEGEEHRVAAQFAPNPTPADTAQNALLNMRAGHVAEIPAGNMIGNARALARLYASLIGEVDGKRLLKAETVDHARMPQTDGVPYFAPLAPPGGFRFPLRFGLGYELYRSAVPFLGRGSFGHTGAGGRLGWADPESGTAIGFYVNSMSWQFEVGPDPRWLPWFEALGRIVAA